MKSILKELGIDLTGPSGMVAFAQTAQGKSTFTAYLVKELHDAGKQVSVISDDSESLWISRLKNIGCVPSDAKIIYKQLPVIKMNELFDFIQKQKAAMPFINCLVLDIVVNYYDKTTLTKIVDFAKLNNMFLFMTSQKRSYGKEFYNQLKFTPETLDKLMLSDIAIDITKKDNINLSFWKKFLNLFRPLFGFEKFKPMNTNVKVLKNRRGRDNYNFEYQLDFKKINHKISK